MRQISIADSLSLPAQRQVGQFRTAVEADGGYAEADASVDVEAVALMAEVVDPAVGVDFMGLDDGEP